MARKVAKYQFLFERFFIILYPFVAASVVHKNKEVHPASYPKQNRNQLDMYAQTSKPPRTIFIATNAVPYFAAKILPTLNQSFVLCTTGSDLTVPYNMDMRCPPFYSAQEIESLETAFIHQNNSQRMSIHDLTAIDPHAYRRSWETIVTSSLLLHWFVENRVLLHPKVSTLPVGMNPSEGHPDDRYNFLLIVL